ncbi:MAG: SusC/RagA family TonB-linked outer membrane protein, partial [Bacteroidales bacterium]|nr:SusC/RagA family TonB-linked outer membrane protein [Bacteroidales bacterium]
MKKAIATVARLLTMACALALCLEIHAQQGVKPVSGVVTDVSGEPIPGVNVLEKGTTNGTITDLDGQYSLTCQPKATLVFSFVGYSTKEIAVSNQSKLNVQLSEDNQALDEVVVIGYGTAKKKDLTGAISTLKAENIEKEIPKSVQDILRAGAAGLYVGMSTDVDGSASLQIRGKNTLTAGSEPLLVVDGVIYNGALQDINPMDIESVDVLKDASSAAVYGAKAASGVIAITTKKGKMSLSKRPTITFNANVGFTTPANLPKKVDGTGFLALRQAYEEGTKTDEEMAKTPGYYSDPRISGVDPLAWYNYDMQTPVSVLPSQDELVSKWLTRLELRDIEIQNYLAGRETDWDDEIFQTGFQQDYTVGIQNRTDRTSYYWSLGYANRDGQIIGAHFENFRSRLNLDCKITDFLSVGTNLQFSNRRGGELKADTDQRLNLSPYSELTTDRTSVYAQYPNGDPTASTHPMWNNYFRDRDELTTRLTASGYAKITLPFGITFTSTFSPDMQWYHYYNHESSENPTWAATGGSSERKETHRYNWQIDNVLRWQYQFDGGHNVELTLLQNAEKKQYWETDDTGKNFSPSDVLGYHKTGAATVPTISSNDTYSTGDALMARAFYSYQGRYMLTASIRRDGYSAFGINNPRATFPSVALGWVFSEEKFMKSIEDVFSYGKLRLSWGINGNNDIGQYEALAQLNASLTPYISVNGTPYIGSQIDINHMGNQNLKW